MPPWCVGDVHARCGESGTQGGDAESVWVDSTVGACGSDIKPAGLNRRMRKTACPVVWEGWRAQSRQLDPFQTHISQKMKLKHCSGVTR